MKFVGMKIISLLMLLLFSGVSGGLLFGQSDTVHADARADSEAADSAQTDSADDADDSVQAGAPEFDFFAGPGIVGGLGVSVNGHRFFGTAGGWFVPSVFRTLLPDASEESPALLTLRLGARWIYESIDIWPEYFHYRGISHGNNDYLQNDFGRGLKFGIGWRAPFPLYLNNQTFIGELKLPSVPAEDVFAQSLLAVIPIIEGIHEVSAELTGSLTVFPNADASAFGLALRLPISFFDSAIRITPVMNYAVHSESSLITSSGAFGYVPDDFSTFNGGYILSIYNLIPDSPDLPDIIGNIVLATHLEGRWYILDPDSTASLGFFLNAFSDLVHISSQSLENGAFFFTLGGGVGFELFGFAAIISIGYEEGRGFNMTLRATSAK